MPTQLLTIGHVCSIVSAAAHPTPTDAAMDHCNEPDHRSQMEGTIVEKRGPLTVVRLASHYGSSNEDALQELAQILWTASRSRPCRILLDCRRLDYFGAQFIGIVASCHEMIRQRHGRMAICRLQPYLRELFQAAGLQRLVNIL